MDETRAIKLCLLHQDPIGFEYLVEKYKKEAYFHALSLLGNQEDAADACQECFTKAFNAIIKLPKLDNFYPWFYRLLRNHCLNLLNKEKTATSYREEKRHQLNDEVEKNSPNFLLEKNEEQLAVWHCLENLSPEFREILIMKYIEHQNYDTISNILNIPRGTVMSRLYHARKAFRNEYSKLPTK